MLQRYGNIPLLLVSALLSAACAESAGHRAVSIDSPPPSMASQAGDHHVLAGEWEYIDDTGAAVLLTLDE